MHTEKDLFRYVFQNGVMFHARMDMNIEPDAPVHDRSDAFGSAAVIAVCPKQCRAEDESVINENLIPAGIGSVQHIGRQDQNVAFGGFKFPVPTYKFSFSPVKIVHLKFIMPVHRHIREIFRKTAFIIAVRNERRAVLSFFFGCSVGDHVLLLPEVNQSV